MYNIRKPCTHTLYEINTMYTFIYSCVSTSSEMHVDMAKERCRRLLQKRRYPMCGVPQKWIANLHTSMVEMQLIMRWRRKLPERSNPLFRMLHTYFTSLWFALALHVNFYCLHICMTYYLFCFQNMSKGTKWCNCVL